MLTLLSHELSSGKDVDKVVTNTKTPSQPTVSVGDFPTFVGDFPKLVGDFPSTRLARHAPHIQLYCLQCT